jgi:hypothetical protein
VAHAVFIKGLPARSGEEGRILYEYVQKRKYTIKKTLTIILLAVLAAMTARADEGMRLPSHGSSAYAPSLPGS